MNKKLSIILIILLTILVFTLIGGLFMLLKTDFDFSSFKISSGYADKLEEKEIDNLKDLNINTKVADIFIEKKEIDNIKVELYSEYAKEYEIKELDNEIKVVLIEKNRFISFGKNPKVVVYVPTTYTNNVKIENKTGDIDIKELSESDLNVELTTGDVEVDKINNAVITTTTGDIEIGEANTLNLSVTTGDINVGSTKKLVSAGTTSDLEVGEVDDITSTTTTGDIEIKNVNNFIDLSATTGDISIHEAIININSKIETSTGDVNIKTVKNCYIDAKTKTGDTKVNNNDRKSDIELIISSKVGDILVNY